MQHSLKYTASQVSTVTCARAFTLTEVVVAIAILGVISVTLGSVMQLALKVAPSKADALTASLANQQVIDRMRLELGLSTALISSTATSVVFQIADRTGDTPEDVSYSWSGTPGSPLQYTMKGRTTNCIDAVDQFNVAISTISRTSTSGTSSVVSAEQLLAWYRGGTTGASGDNSDQVVTSSQNLAQIFSPRLAADATAWNVTRVRVWARMGSKSGTFALQLWGVASDLPVTPSLASVTRSTTDLPTSYDWVSATFMTSPAFTPGQLVAIVIRSMTGGSGTFITARATDTAVPDRFGQYAVSSNTGTWTGTRDGSLAYEVYGTVTRTLPIATTTAAGKVVTITLRPTGASADTSIKIDMWSVP